MSARLLALVAAVSLAGCTFDLDESATADAELLRFSTMTLDAETQEQLALAEASAEAADDELKEAGADLLTALFTASDTAATPDALRHRFGDPVHYGEIAIVCDAPRRPGTKIASAGGFTIFDSAPNTTTLRAHYITGFDDRCARQFSAALVLTGDPGTHEFHRYIPGNKSRFNATDTAYEAVKSSFCRVREGKPCGSRIDALARQTTFVTAYESFGSRPTWVEILLHDGEMSAIDFKSR